MSRCEEISGDVSMPPFRRIEYMWKNLCRNLRADGARPSVEYFVVSHHNAKGCPSPARLLSELHLRYFLPKVLPVGEVKVLEIGCGSGRLCEILAELGYRGKYVGLDVQNRFSTKIVPGFKRTFVLGDAHQFDNRQLCFDLIVTMSALEHIPQERLLLDRLPSMLSPQGLELHYVPSGWGLLVYLWHGYRQYPLKCISEVFGQHGVRVFGLGGVGSFAIHLTLITVSEVLLRLPFRKKFPWLYNRLLRAAALSDRYARFCPTMFAISRVSD